MPPLPLSRLGVIVYTFSSYVMTIYGFALAYMLLSRVDLESFSQGGHKEALDVMAGIYFSVITAATIGYGDIVPLSNLARALVIMEVFIVMIYVVFMFSIVAGFALEGFSHNTEQRNSREKDKT